CSRRRPRRYRSRRRRHRRRPKTSSARSDARVVKKLASLIVPLLAAACSSTYHPEYHPETSYSYAQNVTYAETAFYGVPARAPTTVTWPPSLPAGDGPCEMGRPNDCWRGCFREADGESCFLLGAMFDSGMGVARNAENARRLYDLACAGGYC